MFTQSLLAALGLAGIHIVSSHLRFLDVIPRSRWLSIAGGVAVAYALLHLLPELNSHSEVLKQAGKEIHFPLDKGVYLLTLVGLLVFYGLESGVKAHRKNADDRSPSSAVFWIHVASFGLYNALIGYLLVREDRGWQTLLMFFVGIGLHFVVNDHALWQHHRESYRYRGRWVLAGAILIGWAVGVSTSLHEVLTASLVAFVSGAILLNTFKEELPKDRESRFWAFCLGALGYAAILLAI